MYTCLIYVVVNLLLNIIKISIIKYLRRLIGWQIKYQISKINIIVFGKFQIFLPNKRSYTISIIHQSFNAKSYLRMAIKEKQAAVAWGKHEQDK